jgi:hypothetical protein
MKWSKIVKAKVPKKLQPCGSAVDYAEKVFFAQNEWAKAEIKRASAEFRRITGQPAGGDNAKT